MYAHHQVLVG